MIAPKDGECQAKNEMNFTNPAELQIVAFLRCVLLHSLSGEDLMSNTSAPTPPPHPQSTGPMAPPSGGDERFKFLFELGSREIAQQADAFNHADTKVGVMIGFALVALAQVLGAVIKISTESGPTVLAHPRTFEVLFVLGTISMAVGVIFGFLERRPMDFDGGPTLAPGSEFATEAELRTYALADLKSAIGKNDDVLKTKARLSHYSAAGILGGLALYIALVIAMFFSLSIRSTQETIQMTGRRLNCEQQPTASPEPLKDSIAKEYPSG
jgi:hypothetical protein